MSVGLSAHFHCFRFPLLFHSLDLGNHPVDDVLHLRHVLLHGAEHDVGVNLKVMVGYLVVHPHHAAPVDFGIAGQQLAMRIFRRLSITISRSHIDGLLSDALAKQAVHAVAHSHQIDTTAQHPLQVGLDEVEREQRRYLALVAYVNVAVIGLLAAGHGAEDADARQPVLALCRRLVKGQQV